MISVQFCALIGLTLALLPSTLGVPIFWFPWNYLLPTTASSGSSSSSSNSASSSSSSTTLRPIMANIAIGNRRNTSAMADNGTVINGLTITRGRRSAAAQLTVLPDDAGLSQTSKSFIQVGNQIIRLPPGDVTNLTINIVDGVPYVFGNTAATTTGSETMTTGIFSQIRNFFGELFNRP